MTQKVIELIRVSTEGQAGDDRAGIPAQRAVNKRTATQHGLEIVRSIEMADVSGTAVLRAPEMQQLLRLIEDPEIKGVVAREFSRLMRPERFEDFVLLQAFADTKTMLYLPEGPLDLSTKIGSFIGGMRALIAGWERREIIERMQAAKEEIRKAGGHAAGKNQLPFGVAYSKESGWTYTAEAEKIKRAFDLVLTTDRPYAQIASELNLPRTSLRCILKNPIWIGYRVYSERRDQTANGYVPRADGRQGYRRKTLRAQDEVIRVRVMDGLVSEEVFHAAQRLLDQRAVRQRAIRTKNAPQYNFNGFLFCGVCESPMYSHTNGNKHFGRDGRHYYCKQNGTRARRQDPNSACPTRYIMAGKIEPKIELLLSKRLRDEAFLKSVAQAHLDQNSFQLPVTNAAVTAQQIESLHEKRTRILEAFLDGVIGRDERDNRLIAVDNDLKAYRALSAQESAPTPPVTLQSLTDLFSVFVEMPFLNRDDKRALLNSLGVKIFVVGYQIRWLTLQSTETRSRDTDSHLKTATFPSHEPPCR